MKKRLIPLLVLCVLVCCIFVWQYLTFTFMRGELERQSSAVAAGYVSIVQETLVPLQKTYTLNDTQSSLFTQIQEWSAALMDEKMTLEMKLEMISQLQRSLVQFSTTITTNTEITDDPAFSRLQAQTGERGSIRTLLSTYNAGAAKWNHAIRSDVGALLGRIDGSERSILPYLRFDGEQEFVPVIRL